MPNENDFVEVTSTQLRTIGGRVQVLLEIGGSWRLVIDEPLGEFNDTIISHMVSPQGCRNSPRDPLDAKKA